MLNVLSSSLLLSCIILFATIVLKDLSFWVVLDGSISSFLILISGLDFAFIDGCHGGNKNDCCKSSKFNERCPYTDINTCKKYMNRGGIIFVDDMGIVDVRVCFDNVNWEDYEDLTYLTKNLQSEKKFKIMRKIK